MNNSGILGLLEEMKTKMGTFSPKIRAFLDLRKQNLENTRQKLNIITNLLRDLNINELTQNRQKFIDLEKKIIILTDQNKFLTDQNKLLSDDIAAKQQKIEEKQQEIDKKQQEIKILTENFQIEKTKLEGEKALLEGEKALLEGENKKLSDDNAAKQREIEEKQREIEILTKNFQIEKTKLEGEKALLTFQNKKLSDDNAAKQREIEKLESQNKIIDIKIRDLNEIMMREFQTIENYLKEISIESGNDAVVDAILAKINSWKIVLDESSNNSTAKIQPIPKIIPKIKPENVQFALPANYDQYTNFDAYQKTHPSISIVQWQMGKLNFVNTIGVDDINEFNKIPADSIDKNSEYLKLISIFNQKKSTQGGKKTKKNKRINKMRKLRRGGWTYKGSPSLDSKSSVITSKTSSKTKSDKTRSKSSSSKSKSKSKTNRNNKKHKTKKVIKRSRR